MCVRWVFDYDLSAKDMRLLACLGQDQEEKRHNPRDKSVLLGSQGSQISSAKRFWFWTIFVGPAEDGDGSDQWARILCFFSTLGNCDGSPPVKNHSRNIPTILDSNVDSFELGTAGLRTISRQSHLSILGYSFPSSPDNAVQFI